MRVWGTSALYDDNNKLLGFCTWKGLEPCKHILWKGRVFARTKHSHVMPLSLGCNEYTIWREIPCLDIGKLWSSPTLPNEEVHP